MSNDSRQTFRQRQRADLKRLVLIGLLAAVMVGAARVVTAQEAPAPPAPASNRPSVDVSADAAVDFPGDI